MYISKDGTNLESKVKWAFIWTPEFLFIADKVSFTCRQSKNISANRMNLLVSEVSSLPINSNAQANHNL